MVFNINTNELTPFDCEVRKKTDYKSKKLINHYERCPIIRVFVFFFYFVLRIVVGRIFVVCL